MRLLFLLFTMFFLSVNLLAEDVGDGALKSLEKDILEALTNPEVKIDKFLITQDLFKEVIQKATISDEEKGRYLNGTEEQFKKISEHLKESFLEIRKNLKEFNVDLENVLYHQKDFKSATRDGIQMAGLIRQFSTKTAKFEFSVVFVKTSQGWRLGPESSRWRLLRTYFGDGPEIPKKPNAEQAKVLKEKQMMIQKLIFQWVSDISKQKTDEEKLKKFELLIAGAKDYDAIFPGNHGEKLAEIWGKFTRQGFNAQAFSLKEIPEGKVQMQAMNMRMPSRISSEYKRLFEMIDKDIDVFRIMIVQLDKNGKPAHKIAFTDIVAFAVEGLKGKSVKFIPRVNYLPQVIPQLAKKRGEEVARKNKLSLNGSALDELKRLKATIVESKINKVEEFKPIPLSKINASHLEVLGRIAWPEKVSYCMVDPDYAKKYNYKKEGFDDTKLREDEALKFSEVELWGHDSVKSLEGSYVKNDNFEANRYIMIGNVDGNYQVLLDCKSANTNDPQIHIAYMYEKDGIYYSAKLSKFLSLLYIPKD